MAGDNSLSPYVYGDKSDDGNIPSMILGMKTMIGSSDGRLICLVDRRDCNTKLIEITAKGEVLLKDYKENLDTSDPKVFRMTLLDAQMKAPAQSYGLIMWSHGTGWLPASSTGLTSGLVSPIQNLSQKPFAIRPQPYGFVLTKAFGQDNSHWMNTPELANAIPDNTFQFIIFDACYMASVELLYELRNKTEYVVASPTEILASGFPYSKIIPSLFVKNKMLESGLKDICEKYFQMYDDQEGIYKSAAISLIRTRGLKLLAEKMKSDAYRLNTVNRDRVQRFNRQANYPFFDFTDAYRYTLSDPTLSVVPWQSALDSVIIFSRNTPTFMDLVLNKCCGLSTYVPSSGMPDVNTAYYKTDWYQDTKN